MKPGDFIEWVYKRDNKLVVSIEQLWSTPMQKWVPIGGTALLISVADETYFWLSDKGLYHARVDDTLGPQGTIVTAGGCTTRAWMIRIVTIRAAIEEQLYHA